LLWSSLFASISLSAQTVSEPDTTLNVFEKPDTSFVEDNDYVGPSTLMDSLIAPSNIIVTPHRFDEATWQKIIQGIDYTRNKEKNVVEKPKEKNIDLPSFNFSGITAILQVLLWVLLIGILAIVLLYLFKSDLFAPHNRKVGSETTIDLDNIEQYLQESDLDKYLKQALAQKEYKQAIRLYYLMQIKALAAKQYIEWTKEKTNRQYLYELSSQPARQTAFRETTRIFERVWYGENTFDVLDFERVEPMFKDFLAAI
jgi:Domain of unknown function (DUF4129)